jgi:predicted glycosyltransferase
MTFLFVTGHPAQIHNFRIVKKLLEENGHQVIWASTNKDISFELLELYGIEFIPIDRPKGGLFAKIVNLFSNARRISKIIRQKNVDMVVSRVSPYAAIACKLNRINHIGLADTEVSGIYDTFFSKLLDALITSTTFERTLTKKQIRIPSNIELFYLHPQHFKRDLSIYEDLNISLNDPFVIVRFVSWNAYHDAGHQGFSEENKILLIDKLRKRFKVFISSEGYLPPELEKYRIKLPLDKIHSALAESVLYVGEGASMASESAVLGTPAVFVNSIWSGNGKDLSNYGLFYQFKSSEQEQAEAIDKCIEILNNSLSENKINSLKYNYLKDKIDASSFLCWFITNFPDSRKQLLDSSIKSSLFDRWKINAESEKTYPL